MNFIVPIILIIKHLSNVYDLMHYCLCPLCSVYHGCRTAGVPVWAQLFTRQVLLRRLGHLQRRRVPNWLGVHVGHCGSAAHRLFALFCQICTKGAAVSHPFARSLIIFFFLLFTASSELPSTKRPMHFFLNAALKCSLGKQALLCIVFLCVICKMTSVMFHINIFTSL